MDHNFKIAHVNARSLFTGFDAFRDSILENDFDIMGVSETWLTSQLPSQAVDVPGFKLLRQDRVARRGGGVAAYIRENISSKIVENIKSPTEIECLLVEIKTTFCHFLLGVIYRSPSTNIGVLTEFLEELLPTLLLKYEKLIFLGDLNIDHTFENNVIDIFGSYDFTQIISEPTRISKTSQKILDVIYTNFPDKIIASGTLNADIFSDHCIIHCTLKVKVTLNSLTYVTYRDYKYFLKSCFLQDLQNLNWDDIFYINDIDSKLYLFNYNVIKLFDKHAPLVTKKLTKKFSRWLTENIKKLMKKRDVSLTKFKLTKLDADWEAYRQFRNFCVSAIKKEKAAFLNKINNNNKMLWKTLNKFGLRSRENTHIPSHLNDVNKINDYFLSVFNSNPPHDQTLNYYLQSTYSKELKFSLQLPTVNEIHDIIFDLQSNATGFDGINAKMLKFCSPFIDKYITHILNCCLESGYYPVHWKITLVKPLPKVSEPQNYSDLRPISIISTLSKILEKVIFKQLYTFVTSHNILPPSQSGFRKGFSTNTSLTNILDNIIRNTDNGLNTALISLDFSKAFDTINHALLCAKLKFLGFDASCLRFFFHYLNGRTQMVQLNNLLSYRGAVTSGVPQGSVLGPLLYLLYTFDIANSIQHSTIHAFADDTQLEYSFKRSTVVEANRCLNFDLEGIQTYSFTHNLKLNDEKCSFIVFGPKFDDSNLVSTLNIHCGKSKLKLVKSVKLLGVVFDQDLRFKNHVSLLVKKSYVCLRQLYQNFNIINFKLRKKLCEMLVLPIINYCLTVFYPCLDSSYKYRLQKIQNNCCRFIFKLKKYDHISVKIKQINWLKLDLHFQYLMAVLVHSTLSTSTPPYLKKKLVHRRSLHSANLRHVSRLSMPCFRTALFQRSFSYNAVVIYNNIENIFKSKPVNFFKKQIKFKFLLL